MNNLFSTFDPQALCSLPINWTSSLFILLVFPSLFWVAPCHCRMTISLFLKFVYSEFVAITGSKFVPGGILICASFFVFISLNNFMGLFPYTFTSSSHLTFTIALAAPLWLGHMLMAWTKTTNLMLAHLVPNSTPYALMPLMVLIESVSNLIRPLTLSIRLAANMVAGHLLLTLLGSQALLTPTALVVILISVLVLLSMLEAAVAIIQAYVFSVLSVLYINEVNSPHLNH